ncbi:nuclear transport factor 2 family protein [Henriciella litoralis]|uniref:nuclear transport factor 2 family protein n=1 Tax=Henriciella litoralis TaxID=568102 RepID=UPI0009FC7017|nr:nuclear transport factor 2 family protein [Henriciella litoralis]
MTDFEPIWNIEKQLWTADASIYEDVMAPNCVMVFPLPAGILRYDRILSVVKEAPRWEDVEIDQKTAHAHGDDTVTLSYVGRGLKGTDGYEAFCSSTYVKKDGAWKIVQHQQTPS